MTQDVGYQQKVHHLQGGDEMVVEPGGVFNVKAGGALQFDGVPFTPGGSSTLAADTDVHLTSPAGDDLLAYNLATSKWVNDGNRKAGALVAVSFVSDGSDQTLTFAPDPPHGASWISGFTFTAGLDGLVVPKTGRYLVGMYLEVPQDATQWRYVFVGGPNPFVLTQPLPPKSVIDISAWGPISFTTSGPGEWNAGDVLQWDAKITGAAVACAARVWVQYLGPATSLG